MEEVIKEVIKHHQRRIIKAKEAEEVKERNRLYVINKIKINLKKFLFMQDIMIIIKLLEMIIIFNHKNVKWLLMKKPIILQDKLKDPFKEILEEMEPMKKENMTKMRSMSMRIVKNPNKSSSKMIQKEWIMGLTISNLIKTT